MRCLLASLSAGLFLVTASIAAAALPAPSTAKAGSIQGWVVNGAGQPLAGATVHVYGTTMAGANSRFEIKTGADGKYRRRLPDGIYGARAEHVFQQGGKNYTLALAPTDGTTSIVHDSEEGIAKDFVWRISGLKPGNTAGEPGTHNEPFKYYGGSLQVSVADIPSGLQPLPEGSTLIAELTPNGPLFDGSASKPLSFRRTFSAAVRSSGLWYPSDIPLGRYTLRFRLEQPGAAPRALEAQKSLGNEPYAATVALDVIPDASGSVLPIQIRVKP